MNVLPSEYEAWVALCALLEDQPYNATYSVASWLVCSPRDCRKQTDAQRYESYKRAAAMRKAYALIMWQTGWGWRLRKNYRAELERMKAHIITLD